MASTEVTQQLQGDLAKAGMAYLSSRLKGKSVAADRVLELAGPLLIEMSLHHGRISAEGRLAYQERLDAVAEAIGEGV